MDTSNSGALVKYRLLDDQQEELLSSMDYGPETDANGYLGTAFEVLTLH